MPSIARSWRCVILRSSPTAKLPRSWESNRKLPAFVMCVPSSGSKRYCKTCPASTTRPVMADESIWRSDLDRQPVEILAAEFVDRHRSGECPPIEDYVRRHPDLADEIRDLFPTIPRLEKFKHTNEHSS